LETFVNAALPQGWAAEVGRAEGAAQGRRPDRRSLRGRRAGPGARAGRP